MSTGHRTNRSARRSRSRTPSVAKLIIIFWRDIPSQVIAKRGRDVAKVKLSHRFQAAIERAAMRAGKGSSELYLAEWRRASRMCDGNLEMQARREADKLESQYSNELLERMVKDKGNEVEHETGNP